MSRTWVGGGVVGPHRLPATAGARPDEARRHNRAALLRRLHVDGACTRATLATELGLNRSTIKAVVDGLAETGVVTEAIPVRRTGAGRPSLMVLPDPQAAVVLSVDVRVDRVAMAVVGLGGQSLARHSWNLHRDTRLPGEVITHVAESAAAGSRIQIGHQHAQARQRLASRMRIGRLRYRAAQLGDLA